MGDVRGHKRRRPAQGPDAWELLVNAGNDPVSGRRRQRSRAFYGTATAADTALARFVAEVTDGRNGPATDAPLSVLIDRWLDLVAKDLSPTTVRRYRQIARKQIGPHIGKRPIASITTPQLDAYYQRLLEDLAPATVRQVHAIIRRAFRQAVRWGWVNVNPAVEATPPRVRKPVLVMPTPEQVAALLAAAEATDPEFGCVLRLAAATGARRGELAGLRESKVDTVAGTVLIDRAVVNDGDQLVEKDTKTHSVRPVAIDAGTAAHLRRHMLATRKRALAAGLTRALDPYVFSPVADGSAPPDPNLFTDRFRRLARVHAPGVRLHDLRHFVATRLLAGGVPVKTVSARLGHGSAAMTLDVYAAAIPAADQGAADLLGGLLDG